MIVTRRNCSDKAVRALLEALARAPSMLAAEVLLADLELRARRRGAARSRLVRVIGLDPTYLAAKRSIYALASEEVP